MARHSSRIMFSPLFRYPGVSQIRVQNNRSHLDLKRNFQLIPGVQWLGMLGRQARVLQTDYW